ncbi:MAG: biotin transporter BioY, partial [Halobacteriota archaeon]|nr:biotin transporter BioY [Halobacteriota archaeon]
ITPVPVTGQVFAVLLAGVLLGGRYGSLSQLFYAGIGAAGVPWFAGAASGIGYLTGVTGGYLVGFIVAAFVIGEFTDRYVASRGLVPQMLLMTTGIGIIYTLGSLQLALVLDLSLSEAILMGALPFVPVDLVKAFAAATVAFGILPKTSYTEELDAEKYPYEF